MKVDVEKAKQGTYDLCIIGSGPAGIIVALEYQKHRPQDRVLIIEYGKTDGSVRNRLDDSINIVNPINHHLPYECTNKGPGGSSASWGGRCVMYDEIDFTPREILKGQCTWDVGLLNECRKYSDQTAEYFECGTGTFDLEQIPAFAGSHIAERFQNGEVFDSALERYSLPTRFGKRYGALLDSSQNIQWLTGWEAHELETTSGSVSKVGIRDFPGRQREKISARKVVLAAGTQETTRLLLKNRQVFQGCGGPPASLGKYYQGHISGKIASVRFNGDPAKTESGFLRTSDGVYLRRRLQLSKDALLKYNLLNTALWLDNPLYVDPRHRNGAMSFMYLAMITPGLGKRLAPPAIARSITKGKVAGIPQHLKNILKDFPKSLAIPATTFYGRYCLTRKLPGVFLHNSQNVYAIHFHAEQLPVAQNRMELSADNETLNIYYELTDTDVDSVIRTHDVLDQWLRKCQCGALEYWFPKNELAAEIRAMSKDGLHQAGTTRIAGSSGEGVVDSNLKVWGTSNLYVCSSSVFPTSSQANPTFLLGAFAVRLASRLSQL